MLPCVSPPKPPMPDPGWLILSEDGTPDTYVHAPDESTALAKAREDGCEGEITAVLDDAPPVCGKSYSLDYETAMRAGAYWCQKAPGHRGECGPNLRLPRPSRALVPEGVHVELGMMAWLSVSTENGYRCPTCGRFCRVADFLDAPTSLAMNGARVCYAPRCWRCRGLSEPPYAGAKMILRSELAKETA